MVLVSRPSLEARARLSLPGGLFVANKMRWNGWLVLILLAARADALRSPAPSARGARRGAAGARASASLRPPSMSALAEPDSIVAGPAEELVAPVYELVRRSAMAASTGAALAEHPGLAQLLPAHPAMRAGSLPNGLRFIILPNGAPAGRFEAHLEVFAGSADERDDQQGMAHLVEHVAYMGSRKRERLFGRIADQRAAARSRAAAAPARRPAPPPPPAPPPDARPLAARAASAPPSTPPPPPRPPSPPTPPRARRARAHRARPPRASRAQVHRLPPHRLLRVLPVQRAAAGRRRRADAAARADAPPR